MAKKFTVYSDHLEFNTSKFASIREAYFAQVDHCPETVAFCDTYEEAKAKLAEVMVSTRRYAFNLAGARIAYIEEAEWEQDENGEWEQDYMALSGVWDFRCDELPSGEDDEDDEDGE